MKNISIILGLTVALFFSACKDNSMAQEIAVLNPQEFHDALATKKNIQLVDVRTPEEFAEGHLTGAQNINVLEPDFITEVEKLDLNKPIYVYCRSGKRSAKAALILKDVGFKEIADMEGGFLQWESDGLPKEE